MKPGLGSSSETLVLGRLRFLLRGFRRRASFLLRIAHAPVVAEENKIHVGSDHQASIPHFIKPASELPLQPEEETEASAVGGAATATAATAPGALPL